MSDYQNGNLLISNGGFDKVPGTSQPLTVFIAQPGTTVYDYLYRKFPDYTVTTLPDAIIRVAAIRGTAAVEAVPATIVWYGGVYNGAAPWIVPASETGITIIIKPGVQGIATANLGAGNALIEIQSRYTRLINEGGYFTSTISGQTGSALNLGSGLAGQDASWSKIYGFKAGSFNAGFDFSDTVVFKGSDHVQLFDAEILGAGATQLKVVAGSTSGNCNNIRIINAHIRSNTNNRCIDIAASQNDSSIEGGVFINGGTNSCFAIAGDNWFVGLGAELVNTAASITTTSHINYTGSNFRLGTVWAKGASAAAPVLLST
jgi:hypothetical protein